MALDFETSESTDVDGNFLNAEGTYHVTVISTDEAPQIRSGNRKGEFLDGFEVEFSVIAGDQTSKVHRHLFQNPNLSHKDGGDFARRLQTRFLEVVGLIDPSQKGKKVSIDLNRAKGRQFIVKLKNNTRDGKTYLQVDGGKFWHVDDPGAEKCERDQNTIDTLAKAYRRDPASFAKADAKSNGNGNGHTNGNGTKTSTGAGTVDPDDL